MEAKLISADRYAIARKQMVEEQLREVSDKRVLDAMARVPRHRFVPRGIIDQAYLDRPVNIGYGQTISQPAIVALMTEKLALTGSEKVLEIGTGCGYQTAILAELANEVFTIERIKELMITAQKNLFRLHYKNIHFRTGDGTLGWAEAAPFDAIIVTAAATPKIPPRLLEQLADGGRMVIPSGDSDIQKLLLIKKEGEKVSEEFITYCRFVKLIGKNGWGIDSEG